MTPIRAPRHTIPWLALLGVCVCPAAAQSLFGTILGTVTDASHAVLPRVRVVVRNTSTNAERAVQTNDAGGYEAPALPVGPYEVACEAPGFNRTVVKGVNLEVDQRARVDITLELGQVIQTVEIAATARLIETDTASQGTVVDNQRILQLPLNGRNFQQLAVLGPGVIAPVAGSGGRFSVAGTRGLSNSFMLDGTTNTNINANQTFIDPSVDLIQEFKIQRNTFNAEYGHGAAQVNVVTRSGANSPHFTLFEFLRNEKLQARNFFDRAAKPALRRNQYGGTVSGPLLLPRLYDGRNKTFWLFNYEAVRQRNPSTSYSSVPTRPQLEGDLSGMAAARDPASGQPFPGNRIPVSRMDPASRNYREFMPATDLPLGTFGRGLNWVAAASQPNDFAQFTGKVDQHFSSSSNGFVRYTFNDTTNIQPPSNRPAILRIYDHSFLSRQQNAVFGHNWVLKPNVINEFRAGFSRHSQHQQSVVATSFGRNFAQAVGLKNLISAVVPAANSVPQVSITGFTTLGGGVLILQRVNSYSLVDNVTYIRGRHTFKFGEDIRRMVLDIRNQGGTQGQFNFTGVFTGNPLGDFLVGIPQNASATAPPGVDGVNLTTLWQAFAQDDWRVTPNLTLSLGVRYEYQQPFVNSRNHISRFDPGYPGGRVIYPGDAFFLVPGQGFIPTERPLASRGLYEPDKNNLVPRVGFAWRPFGDNRSSVRGGYGIFIEASNENNNIFSISNPPHLLQQGLTNDVRNPTFVWSQLFPGAVAAGSTSVSSLAARLPAGYVQQWSLNLQREVTGNLAIEAGYMGSRGNKLDQRRNLNQAALDADPGRPTPVVSRLPFPAFASGLNYLDRTGFSAYHAFIARIERKFSRGLAFLAAYTLSKSIDNSSYAGNIGAQPAFPQNSSNLRAERGLSFFDAPQRLVVSYIWELPFGPGKRLLNRRGVLGKLAGGWQLVGITQFQSGNPWSILVAGDWANVGVPGNERADVLADPLPAGFRRGGTERAAFSRAAFALPRRGTYGNSGRNIVRDAGINNFDLGLYKETGFTERTRLQFRMELFNAWNHTQFQQFDNVINNPTFATWNNARAPRIAQLGLKLIY